MNELLLLMGLLVLSYVGGLVVDRAGARGLGLPSGVELVALGVLLGPQALGVIDREMLEVFLPLAHVAVGWLAFALGLELAFAGGVRVRAGSALVSVLAGALAASAIGAAAFLVGRRVAGLGVVEAGLLAAALAAALSEPAAQAMRAAPDRDGVAPAVKRRLEELAHAGALLPLVVAGALYAWQRPGVTAAFPVVVPPLGWLGISVGLGLLLGGVAAVLLARESRLGESWGVVIGTTLFAIGIAVRLDLSAACVAMTLGLGLGSLSRHRLEIIAMVAPTGRTVMMPALLLAGTRVELRLLTEGPVVALVAAVIAARLLSAWVSGGLAFAAARELRPAGAGLGLALFPTGMLALALGLAVSLRFPGALGDTVLLCAAVVTLLGELVGAAAMPRVLGRAEEAS